MDTLDSERAAIIELIHRNRIAIWTNDFELWDSCFVHAPYMTRWGWWRGGGIYVKRGFEENAARLRSDHPPVDLDNAYKTKIEDLSLQIGDGMAWATFIQQYPSDDYPGHAGLGRRHELRVFEKHDGAWKIALLGVLDGNAGDKGTAVLRLDADGRRLEASPAALAALATDDDLVTRNGVLRFRDRRADRQLREALAWAAALDSGYSARNGARPIVVEAGEGLAARIYWVIADAGVIMFSFSRAALDESRLAFAAAVYGLSPAQSQLVRLVAEGLALPEIAERMNITPHTARTHLNRVFDKTGVRSQAALVRVLLTAVAPL